jgi:hypothetical protein
MPWLDSLPALIKPLTPYIDRNAEEAGCYRLHYLLKKCRCFFFSKSATGSRRAYMS